ncbi:MAG: DUF2161 domain-containing phosphodiesterase [Pseudomonadota bacterium]
MAGGSKPETDLYEPVKGFLEGQGYHVKSEIDGVDVMARRGTEDCVLVELKNSFTLTLVHQAIARQSITDLVYVAVPGDRGQAYARTLKKNLLLCRRLGLGLITVGPKESFVVVHLDPAPYRPRKSKVRQARLLKEFAQRVGDPNMGGTGGRKIMTAYRQDALRCLWILSQSGPSKASEVAKAAQVDRARRIMADNHYGWFDRIRTGIYDLSPNGKQAMSAYEVELNRLKEVG